MLPCSINNIKPLIAPAPPKLNIHHEAERSNTLICAASTSSSSHLKPLLGPEFDDPAIIRATQRYDARHTLSHRAIRFQQGAIKQFKHDYKRSQVLSKRRTSNNLKPHVEMKRHQKMTRVNLLKEITRSATLLLANKYGRPVSRQET